MPRGIRCDHIFAGSLGGCFAAPVFLAPTFGSTQCFGQPPVEGPVTINAGSTCGPHIACGLPAQAQQIQNAPKSTMKTAKCNIAPSTSVTPVRIQQSAPEPPQTGAANPSTGQVPGSALSVSASVNSTSMILIVGAVLVGLYFISR